MRKNCRDYQTLLGIEIKKYRIEYGITQIRLANMLGVSKNTIHVWENQSQSPSVGNLIELSAIMHLRLTDVIDMSKELVRKDMHFES